MDRARTAREQRETRRADTSRSLARVLLAHDVAHAEVARICGVSETMVHEWCDPTKPRALALADAMALPERTRLVLAELLAGEGHVLAPMPDAGEGADLTSAIAVQRETGDVVSKHLAAIADGHITRAEASELRVEIAEAIRSLVRLDRACQRAEREGVVGLRVVGGGA